MVPDAVTWCLPDWDILVCPIRTGGRDATPSAQPQRSFLDLATGSAAVLDTGSRAAKKQPRVSGAEE
jgi:hypothetical protein